MNQKVVNKWSANFGVRYHGLKTLVCGYLVAGNCDVTDRRSRTEKNGTSRHHSCAAVPISQFGNVVFAVCDKLGFVNGKIFGCNPCNSIICVVLWFRFGRCSTTYNRTEIGNRAYTPRGIGIFDEQLQELGVCLLL